MNHGKTLILIPILIRNFIEGFVISLRDEDYEFGRRVLALILNYKTMSTGRQKGLNFRPEPEGEDYVLLSNMFNADDSDFNSDSDFDFDTNTSIYRMKNDSDTDFDDSGKNSG